MSSTRRLVVAVPLAGLLALVLLPVHATASHVQCGDEITQDTTLDSDVLGCSSPVNVTGNAVTLNLNGHTLEGGVSTPVSDVHFRSSLVVEDGTVRNGRVLAGSVHRAIIRNLHADGIGGIFAGDLLVEGNEVSGTSSGCGIGVGDETRGLILNNEVRGCRWSGVSVGGVGGTSGLVAGNVIEGNGIGVSLGLKATHVRLEGNTIRANARGGVSIAGWYPSATATSNHITGNGGNGITTFGDARLATERNVISRNAANGIGNDPTYGSIGRLGSKSDVISSNGLAGIDVRDADEVVLLNDVVSDNRTDGIHFEDMYGSSAEITGTRADRNGDDGIDIDDARRVTLTRNHAWFNGDLGIEAVPGVIDGGGNWAKHNGNPLQCLNVACSTTGKPKS
jgi:hypothetical protein